MISKIRPVIKVTRLVATSLGVLALAGLSSGCAGSSPHAATPTALVGLDVLVGPGVGLSGEGVGRFPTFGAALTYAIVSRLQTDGFAIVPPDRAQSAVRIALEANLEVSRSRFIFINGRPLESNSARVVVRVLAPDGAPLDAFEVSGDPEDAQTPNNVAANLAERMKASPQLVAFATATPRASVPPPSVAAATNPSRAVPERPVSSPARAQVSPALGTTVVCESNAGGAASFKSSGRGPEVAQIRVGMTRDEVVAICCRIPAVAVHERYVATTQSGEEETVAAGTTGGELLEDAYLTNITCGSSVGLTQIRFAPPPAATRVLAINHMAYAKSIAASPESYLAGLLKEYGNPKTQSAPEVVDRSRGSFARAYKWLFSREGRDRDCSPTTPEGDEPSAPPEHRACATELAVRIVSDPTSVIAAIFSLFNAQDLDEAHDRHVAQLNERHGTHFEDAKTLEARALEEAKQVDAAAKRQREADRRAQLSPEELAREDADRNSNAFFTGLMGLAAAAAAADQAAGRTGNRASSVPQTGRSNNQDEGESPFARAQRHSQCVDSCQLQVGGCNYEEDPGECSTRLYNQRQGCISRCGP